MLPQLGEENIRARTLREVVEGVLGKKVEKPYRQLEALLGDDGELRRRSVHCKGGAQFLDLLSRFADDFAAHGPDFRDVRRTGRC